MDRTSITGSPDVRENQDRQGRSLEGQDQPRTSREREDHYLRYSRSASSDSPSTSDTNHTTAIELGQQRDQDHPQHDREQERQANIFYRMLDCMIDCILPNLDYHVPHENNHWYQANSNLASARPMRYYFGGHHWETAYWYEPEPYRQEEQRQREERKRQKMRGELLGIDLSKVEEKRWIEFGNHLMAEYGNLCSDREDQNEKKNLRLLGDILIQGGISKHVNHEQRNSEEYESIKKWVSEQWKEWDKKTNEHKLT